MLKKYATLILLVLFITFSSDVLAQTPCPNPGPGPCNPPPVPVDGGVGFLLVLGIGYAVSRLKKDKK